MLYFTLLIGLFLVIMTTKLTQKFKLSSIWLIVGQISASLIIILFGDLEVSYINQIELGFLAIPFSLLFLVGFTNVMNIEQEQQPLILLLPCISLLCLSTAALIMGNSFVSISGLFAVLTIMLCRSVLGGKVLGRPFTISLGFVIAVLSLSLLKFSFVTIYIPIFTLALPLAIYLFLQNKITSAQSMIISASVAVLFGLLMFVIPFNVVWYMVVGATVILAISQLSSKYRFI
ncbi:UDP-N-acetylmuramyl pentapeptide phosphotransferase [Solibacillus isronensis]|uniref:UDP-N-acetylmuramyl pentapeptide phosphotransferase n=1 Tax=Solibacillus isronensis TaxID=412383 RepID=UPI00203EFD07|nr:UDP-N-acetylmuramyl pentapeptide phosphotransferase [Solibacillus isronensis]MCM3721580.1 UDP-N-acetylmuramyl pentapeptide phosphotransferase [Solibacillus isronensis]